MSASSSTYTWVRRRRSAASSSGSSSSMPVAARTSSAGSYATEPLLLTSRSASTATYSRRKRAAAGQSARPSFSPSRASSTGPTPRSAARISRSRSCWANARVRSAGRRSSGQPTGSSPGSSPTTSSSSRMIRSCSGPVSSRGEGSPRSAAARRSNPKAYAGNVRTSGSRITRCPSPAMRASIRWRSSVAPRRPKVSTRMRSGSTPSATRAATASTSVDVLPVPGPPTTSIGPSVCATTSACTGSTRRETLVPARPRSAAPLPITAGMLRPRSAACRSRSTAGMLRPRSAACRSQATGTALRFAACHPRSTAGMLRSRSAARRFRAAWRSAGARHRPPTPRIAAPHRPAHRADPPPAPPRRRG